ncbi:MAG: hypothetical protein JSW41_00650 [Candidatus Aenigmatarchaeota archaeon]|nr:MAG: hypothetical protein JSW41_00650 [Candidatus Aenigmarchaeota archaeon]
MGLGRKAKASIGAGILAVTLGGGIYVARNCDEIKESIVDILSEDISSIYHVEEIGNKKYLVIDGVPKVYKLERVEVRSGDGYDSLIFRGIEDYNRMSQNNECRLPQILRDINGGELIAGMGALGPTDVLTEEEFQELMEKYKKN